MYVKVVLRVERDNYGSVIVNTTAQCVSRLLCTHYMTELNKNLTVRITHNHSTR